MDTALFIAAALIAAVIGAYDLARCRRRRAGGKLPEDIQ